MSSHGKTKKLLQQQSRVTSNLSTKTNNVYPPNNIVRTHKTYCVLKLLLKIQRSLHIVYIFIQLRSIQHYTNIYIYNCNFYLWEDDQFIERWNRPIERIPHNEQRFVFCRYPYWRLDCMKHHDRNSCPRSVRLNERDPSCRCQLSGVSVSGWQIFPREAVC